MSETSIAQQKEALRELALEARNGIDPIERLALAEKIHTHLYDVPEFRDAASVALYWSAGSQVLTVSLAIKLWEEEQRRIFLPFVRNGALQITEWRTADPVVDAPYGGMQPRYSRPVPLEEVDVILVPGLAFDARGARLGSGTGHYDRLLARMDLRTTRIGLGFGLQLIDAVPVEAHDQPVHAVVTDLGAVICSSTATDSRTH